MSVRPATQTTAAVHFLLPLLAAILLAFALYPLADFMLRDSSHGLADERMAPPFQSDKTRR